MSRGGCDVVQQGQTSFPLTDQHLLDKSFIGDVLNESGQMVLRGGVVLEMPMPAEILKYLTKEVQSSELASGAGYTSTNYEMMLGELVGPDKALKLVAELDTKWRVLQKTSSQRSCEGHGVSRDGMAL